MNKSSTNFYKIDKNMNVSNLINSKKKIAPSENISAKKIGSDKSTKKVNKIKTLSYSNSTQDIYSDKKSYKSINNYNSNNIINKKKYQIPINNINYIHNNWNNKKQRQNSNNIFSPPLSKGVNSNNTNININNYYLNNIFSSINNNYMTNNNNLHVNYFSKNNNEMQRKFISHRSSSVIATKKGGHKMNLLERKNKYKNNNFKSNNRMNNKNNIPNRKINRVGDNAIKSPSTKEHFFSKIKSNSVYEHN